MFKKIKKVSLTGLGIILNFFFSGNSYAQSSFLLGDDAPRAVYGVEPLPLGNRINGIINLILAMLFIAVPFFIGIVAYLKKRKGKKIKKTILWGVVAMTLIVITFFVVQFISSVLG